MSIVKEAVACMDLKRSLHNIQVLHGIPACVTIGLKFPNVCFRYFLAGVMLVFMQRYSTREKPTYQMCITDICLES